MIKEAAFRDCQRITDFCRRMHEETKPAAKFSASRTRKALQAATCNPTLHKVWFAEVEGKVEGVLIGVTNQVWYSGQKEAYDLMFMVSEEGRGYGGMLARRFVRWARQQPGVVQVILSEALGASERTERMYERLGFNYVGKVFRLEVQDHERSRQEDR